MIKASPNLFHSVLVGIALMPQYFPQNNSRSSSKFGRRSSDNLSVNEATVVSAIEPGKKGRVRLHGVFWFARASSKSYGTIFEGDVVLEVGRVGNTLIVRPALAVEDSLSIAPGLVYSEGT